MEDQRSADALATIASQLSSLTQVLIDMNQTLKKIEQKLPAKAAGNLN